MAAVWSVSTLERNTADGGVTVVHWRVLDSETVGEDTYSASSYGTCGFEPDPSSSDFIAYADLTESTVLDWCWASGVDKDAVEASLTAKIAEDKNPTSAAGVPW
tara:strand:+ start:332 stop:643 length:312 start_codon:yes stop_codon:yes gene_type:complete